MKLSNRIFYSFFGIILLGGFASALVGAVLISRAVRSEAFLRVQNELKTAHLHIDSKLKELSFHAQARIHGDGGKILFSVNPDYAAVIPDRENVLARFLRDEGLALRGLETGIFSIPVSVMEETGFDFSELDGNALCSDERTLWLVSTASGGGQTAFSGILLNGDAELVGRIQELLYGREYYGTKPFGTVTVFCGDRRVATTVVGPSGDIAVGTRVSDIVREKVLVEREIWLDRAYVVDDWYLSAYEPLFNPKGEPVGILYVGVLERKYLDIKRRAMFLLSGITIPTLLLLVFGVYFISRSMVKPISDLARASSSIASGNLDITVSTSGAANEIKTLSGAFNRMAEAIGERERELKETNEELSQRSQDYQELLSFVTHELNNSIGSLLLNVSILEDGTVGRLEAEQREVVELIIRDVQRFREMVRNYLNISRLEKGTLRFNPVWINLRERVVQPVVDRLRGRIAHREMDLLWDWKEESVVYGDPELLDICYSNLIVNALKYGKKWVKLTFKEGENGFVLGVENGGPPISGEEIHLLFQKFSRLVKSDDGAGLGLYLVRQIAERHGGEVWCESNEERTGFYMRLPKVEVRRE